MFYTINSSSLHVTKLVFMLTIILSSYQKCPVPLSLNFNITISGIKPFKCDLCTYATANKQHLVGHMAKHSTVRLNCTKCEFSTAWKQRLRAHLKAHEMGTLHQKKDPEANAGSEQVGDIRPGRLVRLVS